MDLRENIQSLIELQAIDLQVRDLKNEMESGLVELEKRKESIEKHKTKINSLTERKEACEKKKRELESEIEDEYARIKDRQTKLMNVQTNREYQSLLKEIEDGKATNKQREDEVVLLMEEVESITAKMEEEQNLCQAEEKLLAEEEEKVDAQSSKLKNQQEKIEKSRVSKAKKVADNVLKKYELLREKRNGLAIIGVTKGVCHGCNMNIPPQLFNNLLREEELLSCPTCNRMIYHQPENEK